MCRKEASRGREQLARKLYECMDKIDPESGDWGSLEDAERDYYRSVIDGLFLERATILAVLGLPTHIE